MPDAALRIALTEKSDLLLTLGAPGEKLETGAKRATLQCVKDAWASDKAEAHASPRSALSGHTSGSAEDDDSDSERDTPYGSPAIDSMESSPPNPPTEGALHLGDMDDRSKFGESSSMTSHGIRISIGGTEHHEVPAPPDHDHEDDDHRPSEEVAFLTAPDLTLPHRT